MFYFYVLRSINSGRYYVGSCENVSVRLRQHNTGLVRSTKNYLPWEFVYREEYKTLSEARKREYQVKSWKKRLAIERLIKHF